MSPATTTSAWHTRDGVTLDLLGEWTPCLDSLTHNTLMLTLHALGSGTLATLAEVDDRLHSILGVDLDLVEGVLDDGGGHGVVSPVDEHSIHGDS